MMWTIIFAAVLIAAVAGIIFLVNRLCKLNLVNIISKGNKRAGRWISIVLLLVIFGAIWLLWGSVNAIICLLHLAVFWLLCDGIVWGIRRVRGKEFRRYYTGAAAFLVTAVYLAAGWILVHGVWQTNYTIETDKNAGKLRIVQFSDSHTGTTFDGEGFAGLVSRMQEQKPDVVLITGDFVDDDTSLEDMKACCRALGRMETTYGIYFAFGNHDKGYYDAEYRGYDGDDLIAELEANNVTVLQDESVLIDDRFYIIGRQDRSEEMRGGKRAEMSELVGELDKSKFMIVMDHQPCDYDNQAAAGVDLVLSGHTHGGQLIPLTLLGKIPGFGGNDRTYGYEERGNTGFIVSSGISDWAIKFKTGCRSEFVVIDVQGK